MHYRPRESIEHEYLRLPETHKAENDAQDV